MSRQHEALLRPLCHDPQTLSKAKDILHSASIRTAHGTGYELGQGIGGLPAICALLAAEELGDTDITEKVAQNASCLKPKVFKTTLNIVRSALAAAAAATASQKKTSRTVTYRQLLDDYRVGRKGMVAQWMEDAERAVMANQEIRRLYGRAYDAITLSVFCWTLGHMKKKMPNIATLLDKYNVSRDHFEGLTEAVHQQCKEIERSIKETIASLKAGTSAATSSTQPKGRTTRASSSRTSSDTVNPAPAADPEPESESEPAASQVEVASSVASRSPTKSPTKSALRAPSVGLTPTKTPTHKRKVVFDAPIPEEDEEFDPLATPSRKRQRTTASPEKLPLPALPTPVRASSRLAIGATHDGASTPLAGPSTPRRQRVAPAEPSSTHSNRSARSSRTAAPGSAPSTPRRKGTTLPTVFEEEATRRRYRPVFADQQQWLKGDARLERELKPWAQKWRELVKSAGGDVWKAVAMA